MYLCENPCLLGGGGMVAISAHQGLGGCPVAKHPLELQKDFLLPLPTSQGPEHPNPGKSFTARGFPRHCYLPDSEKGRKVSWPRHTGVGKANMA